MPQMGWEEFLRDHHRPHLLKVKLEGTILPKLFGARANLERLASLLGATGNYAFKVEATTVYAG